MRQLPAAAASASGFRVIIDCRIRQFVLTLAGASPMLLDDTHDIALQPSPSDPGLRFEAESDPSTFVHAHGTSADVAVRGVLYAGCSLSR